MHHMRCMRVYKNNYVPVDQTKRIITLYFMLWTYEILYEAFKSQCIKRSRALSFFQFDGNMHAMLRRKKFYSYSWFRSKVDNKDIVSLICLIPLLPSEILQF